MSRHYCFRNNETWDNVQYFQRFCFYLTSAVKPTIQKASIFIQKTITMKTVHYCKYTCTYCSISVLIELYTVFCISSGGSENLGWKYLRLLLTHLNISILTYSTYLLSLESTAMSSMSSDLYKACCKKKVDKVLRLLVTATSDDIHIGLVPQV